MMRFDKRMSNMATIWQKMSIFNVKTLVARLFKNEIVKKISNLVTKNVLFRHRFSALFLLPHFTWVRNLFKENRLYIRFSWLLDFRQWLIMFYQRSINDCIVKNWNRNIHCRFQVNSNLIWDKNVDLLWLQDNNS